MLATTLRALRGVRGLETGLKTGPINNDGCDQQSVQMEILYNTAVWQSVSLGSPRQVTH